MVERDEQGYLLKIVSNFPYHPWWQITAKIAEAFRRKERPSIISSIGIYTPKFGLGSLENPKTVGKGEADVGITNPPLTTKLAMEAKGPYKQGVGILKAIARFPEPDYIFWLVADELGIGSMEELVERKEPLTLVTGRIGPTGPDVLTWTVEEVMKNYGFNYKDVETWGGKVLFPGPSTVGVPLVKKGEANAIFQEGMHNVIWEDLVEARPMRCLPLNRRVVDHMKRTYGFDEAIIPRGRLKGIEEDLLTIDFGGWLLFCREDLPDELAYLLARVSVEQSDLIAAPYKDQPEFRRGLEFPMTPQHLSGKCVIPLHPGAEAYYKEIGCI